MREGWVRVGAERGAQQPSAFSEFATVSLCLCVSHSITPPSHETFLQTTHARPLPLSTSLGAQTSPRRRANGAE